MKTSLKAMKKNSLAIFPASLLIIKLEGPAMTTFCLRWWRNNVQFMVQQGEQFSQLYEKMLPKRFLVGKMWNFQAFDV